MKTLLAKGAPWYTKEQLQAPKRPLNKHWQAFNKKVDDNFEAWLKRISQSEGVKKCH